MELWLIIPLYRNHRTSEKYKGLFALLLTHLFCRCRAAWPGLQRTGSRDSLQPQYPQFLLVLKETQDIQHLSYMQTCLQRRCSIKYTSGLPISSWPIGRWTKNCSLYILCAIKNTVQRCGGISRKRFAKVLIFCACSSWDD